MRLRSNARVWPSTTRSRPGRPSTRGTLTLSAGDVGIDDRLVAPGWSCAETGEVGRRLHGFAVAAGLDDVAVETVTLSFTDFESADSVLGFTGRIDRLRAADELSDATAQSWLSSLRDAEEQFFSSLTLFTVSGTVPVGD